MEINIIKTENEFEFVASNENSEISIVGSPEFSDDLTGFRPMQLLLTSLGGCMSIDVLNILKKQKQKVDEYKVKLSASRTDNIPSVFKDIQIQIHIKGEVSENKLQKAIDLSVDKYCSVYKILSQSSTIVCTYILNDEK